MSYSRTHVLLAEQYNGGLAASDTFFLAQPPNLVDWPAMYDELTWTLSLKAVTGSPTAYTLTAQFLYRQMHAGAEYRFMVPRYYTPSSDNIDADIAEQVGWYGPGQTPPIGGAAGTVAATGTDLTSPLVLTRTMRNLRPGTRVQLGLSFTGGTSPKAQIGLEVTGRKR